MKTRKIVTLLIAYLLILSGCRKQISTVEPGNTTQPSPHPAKVVAATEATESTPTEKSKESEETVNSAATETPSTETTSPPSEQEEQKSATEPTKTKPANPSPTKKEAESTKPKSTKPETKPTVPSPTTPKEEPSVTAPTKPEAAPVVTTPTQPETEPTKPKPEPAVPESKPTEPAGCSHDWKAIHHKEKGHWKAGIICDCGWTAYGKADELVAKWNAHSASYPAEESLFEHGGYGSADKWVVDEPAYDEWVCRHCGEPKP